ncbi:M16 family metallopeptidase [Archangium lansingense]|uniref:Pitrilysin family protein n=1 Tax=Archangium lansingense TaxID=2995310 RepID=A0ABT4AQW3_9BACT|nr:pitrilysin family protein [Archangium lansinium]MCY1083554.1 pitrilysin family protein [Archangium lansinium]
MKKALIAAAVLALGLPAFAQQQQQEAKPLAPGREALTIPYETYKLPNGLEVILAQDKKLPVVAVNVWYHVGAYNEQPGRTGFAHLFEHMMFQGSKHVPDDVHIAMLEQVGANDLNGTTNYDRTNYFETVPTNHLATALWLESDRMGFLLDALDEKKLHTQQEVVKNERRQGVETRPYGLAQEKLWQALFPAPHPYHGKVIGSMADLDAATMEDVKGFFRKWYAPSNATLAVVGDFEPKEARALIEKYFGTLPSGPKPEKPQVAPVKLTGETVIRHDEKVGTLPQVTMAWLTPAYLSEGDATADVLANALGTGKSSRLYKRLVLEKGLAQNVSATQTSLGAQSVFTVEAVARPGVSSDALAKEMDAVLEEVRRGGMTQQELDRARTRFETQMLAGLQSVGGFGGKADVLQSYNHYQGDPGFLGEDLARYDAVTADKVRDFAREYLKPDARVVVHAVPAQKGPISSAKELH